MGAGANCVAAMDEIGFTQATVADIAVRISAAMGDYVCLTAPRILSSPSISTQKSRGASKTSRHPWMAPRSFPFLSTLLPWMPPFDLILPLSLTLPSAHRRNTPPPFPPSPALLGFASSGAGRIELWKFLVFFKLGSDQDGKPETHRVRTRETQERQEKLGFYRLVSTRNEESS